MPDPPATNHTRKPTLPKGYAALPGTGPAGETCRTCRHKSPTGFNARYYKCYLVRHRWTHGISTDIRVRWPACSKWQAKTAT